MKKLIQILCLLALAGFHPNAMASGVFKCRGSDGEMAFSFTPCGNEQAPAPAVVVDQEPKKSRSEELARVDSGIGSLQAQLGAVKKEYEIAIRANQGKGRTDKITHKFDESSANLISQLIDLRQERTQLARL